MDTTVQVIFSCQMCGALKSGFTPPFGKEEWAELHKNYETSYGAILPEPCSFNLANTGTSYTLCRSCHDRVTSTVEHIIRGERIVNESQEQTIGEKNGT